MLACDGCLSVWPMAHVWPCVHVCGTSAVMVKISTRQTAAGCVGVQARVSADSRGLHNITSVPQTGCQVVKEPRDAPRPPDNHGSPAVMGHRPHMGTARTRRTEQSQYEERNPTVDSFLIRACVCLLRCMPFCVEWSEAWRRRFYPVIYAHKICNSSHQKHEILRLFFSSCSK